MLRNLNVSNSGRRILGTPYVGLLAEAIFAETATGDHGPGLLYDEALAYPGQRLRLRITTPPSAGTLFVWENGAVDFADAPDGAYSTTYERFVDDVSIGSDTATFNVGAVDASATGATLTGTATLAAGAASGESNATAPGATLTGDADLVAGTAVGEANASAAGASLTGTATLEAGTATGSGDGAAGGVVLTGTATLAAGSATGQSNATAPGATLTSQGELQAGAATGGTGATDGAAPGATLTGTATLAPGAAAGNTPGVSLSPADIAAIAAAVWSHPEAASLTLRLAEAWARLGLDPARPVVQDETSISFGAVLMALAQSGDTVTVTRQ